jgi:AcrR family transcriptional regulator
MTSGRQAEAEDDVRRSLPRGPHGLDRDVVLASQRGRMLDAMAATVAAKGYAGTTVADVVAGARVSRKTFYEHFADKEEAFLAAFDAGVEVLMSAILEARGQDDSWLSLMRARVRAYLETLASQPAFARTFLLEVFVAGPRAIERRGQVLDRFAQLFRDLHAEALRAFPDLPRVPEPIFAAAVGGVNELVSAYVREGRTAELAELEPAIVFLQVALFAGSDTAQESLPVS